MKINQILKDEMVGLFGDELLKDFSEIIDLYEYYEKKGQKWESNNTEYERTTKITNYTKKLIDEQARFLFGKMPHFEVLTEDTEQSEELTKVIRKVFYHNNFESKLLKASKDALIGKRVAIKLNVKNDRVKISCHNSLSFVFETEDDDIDDLKKIIFFAQLNNETDPKEQRLWKQKYEMLDGSCILTELIVNGCGEVVEYIHKDVDTELGFIPAVVLVNSSLTNDLKGVSEVDIVRENQDVYNLLTSDDIDALKFNMFPIIYTKNADEESLKNFRISPSSFIDLQSDISQDKDVELSKLESSFDYNAKLENTLDRIKKDMFEMMSVPLMSEDNLRSLTSAKAIKAQYYQLIISTEEKFNEWKSALIGLVEMILKVYDKKISPLDLDGYFSISFERELLLLEDEQEEKELDKDEVLNGLRSRKSYLEKWGSFETSDEELRQIAKERELLENSYF